MLQDKKYVSIKLSKPKLKKRNRALSFLVESFILDRTLTSAIDTLF